MKTKKVRIVVVVVVVATAMSLSSCFESIETHKSFLTLRLIDASLQGDEYIHGAGLLVSWWHGST
jgi:hypothetical protein